MRVLLALILLIPVSLLAVGPARDFKSSDGKVLRATLIDADAENATLERVSDSRRFTLPLERLSEIDQTYIKKWVLSNEPVTHPLGWKRLRIHAPPRTTITTGEIDIPLSPEGDAEIYLPVGTWVRIFCTTFDRFDGALKEFKGESDWYITNDGYTRLMISTERGKPGAVAGFTFGDILHRGDDHDFPTFRESLEYIEAGASVQCSTEKNLNALIDAGAKPSAMIVRAGDSFNWAQLPSSVRACYQTSSGSVDFAGIADLGRLEALMVDARKKGGSSSEIRNTKQLSALPKLTSLSLDGIMAADEFPPLGKLIGLRHLNLHSSSTKPDFAKGTFDSLGKLTALERFTGTNLTEGGKALDPGLLKNCTNLTTSDFVSGKSLSGLPNLTHLYLGNDTIDRKLAHKLMEQGHFQHVQYLRFHSNLMLKNFPELHTLTLLGGAILPVLGESGPLPKLRALELKASFSPKELEDLSQLPISEGIEKLILLGEVSALHLAALGKFPALHELQIHNFHAKETPNALDFTPLTTLQSLSLKFGRQPTLETVKGIRNLRSLKIQHCPLKRIGDRSGFPNLELLSIDRAPKELVTLKDLGRCPNLRELYLNSNHFLEPAGVDASPQITSAIIIRSRKIAVHKIRNKK